MTDPEKTAKMGSRSTPHPHQSTWPRLGAKSQQWLLIGAFLYGLLAILLSIWPTVQLINRPYGGFLWSWDNQRGLYRVDESFISPDSQLQKADFLLTVEGVTASPQLSQEVQHLYDQHTAVCTANQSLSQFSYTIERQGQQLQLTSPLACFRVTDWLRLVTLPITIAFLVWLMGVIVYRANPRQEINATFAIFASFSTAVIAKQIFHEPGIHTLFSQTVAFLVSVPAPILSAAVFLHLAALLPRQHPFTQLRRLGWLLYGLVPAALLLLGWWQFLAAATWAPVVGKVNAVWGIGNIFLRYSGPVLLIIRSLYLLRHSQNRQAVGQSKLIAISMAFSLFIIPFELTLHAPQFIRWWWPISQPALLFWTSLGFIGLAFAILRYQLFSGRMRALYLLVIIFVSILFSLVSTPLLQLPIGLLIPILFLLLLGISLFWTLPAPLQTTLRRFALPGIIQEKELVQFNLDIQGQYDLETLPLQIVQSLETHLELSFAVLWLAYEPEIGILETYTDHAPAQNFPSELPLENVWQAGVQRLITGVLADTGCEIALFLTVREQKVGVLGLGPRWTEDVFDATDLQTLAVIAQQSALALNTARQIRALSRVPMQVEQAQLKERERIAQDLHDSTQARLTQLLFVLEKIRSQIGADPALAEIQVDTAVANVNQTAWELRTILRDLLPQRLPRRTFIDSLNEYLGRLKHLHPKVQIQVEAEKEINNLLPENDQLGLLRVCQQAVDNALQHGQPTAITLIFQLHLEQHQLSFAISDNGRGFVVGESTDLQAQGHHGLYIMQARLQQQGGQLHVQSAPGEGTVIMGYVLLSGLS